MSVLPLRTVALLDDVRPRLAAPAATRSIGATQAGYFSKTLTAWRKDPAMKNAFQYKFTLEDGQTGGRIAEALSTPATSTRHRLLLCAAMYAATRADSIHMQ